jgi:hypothetical protein
VQIQRITRIAACLLLVAACRERAVSKPAAESVPCSQVGQRCEVSPGKLGSCVQRDDCQEKNCFVCQSQH